MPVQFTMPPDTRAVGTGDPPNDVDALIRASNALGATYNVLNAAYSGGADPTGAADSTAAINAASTAADAVKGVVYFPAGTYKVTGLVKKNATWQGAGRNATIIQLASGTNAPILVSDQFATLTLTGQQAGINGFAIRDMTFDGNAAGQSTPAAAGVQIYGCDYLLENVSIRNCLATDGLYTEWGAGSGSAQPDKAMESMFRFLRVHDNTCTGAGWHNRGPHDSNIVSCWVYTNSNNAYGYWAEAPAGTYTATGLSGTAVSSTPSTVTLNTTLSLPTAGTATMPSGGGTVTLSWTGTTATTLTGVGHTGGSGNYSSNTFTPLCLYSGTAFVVYGLHVWGDHNIAVVADTPGIFASCEAEGASTGQVLVRSGAQWNAGRVFTGGSNAVNSYGIQLGDTTNQAQASMLNWPVLSGFTGGTAAKAYVNIVNEASGQHEVLCQLSGANQAIFGTLGVTTHRKMILVQGGATTPAIAIQGTGAGTGPPTPTVSNATDLRLTASLGTGTGPTAGVQARVTWAQPKPGTPKLVISPENSATAILAPYLIGFSSTVVDIGFGNAPAASQATGTYVVGIADVTG